jgi:hypothetical protein
MDMSLAAEAANCSSAAGAVAWLGGGSFFTCAGKCSAGAGFGIGLGGAVRGSGGGPAGCCGLPVGGFAFDMLQVRPKMAARLLRFT